MEEQKAESGSSLGRLTAGDWIGAVIALLGAIYILVEGWIWLPAWEQMFEDFGAATLPWATRLILWGPFPYLAVLPALVALCLALLPRGKGLAWRRIWIVVAFLLALAGIAFIEVAARMPLWELSEAVA